MLGGSWEAGLGSLMLGHSIALTSGEIIRLHQPGCPPDPWTESCRKADLWGKLWDKGHQGLFMGVVALWVSPRAESRDPRALQRPGRATTYAPPPPSPSCYVGQMWV